ncbi:opacity protein-like surface antigen [Flavobacterium sp. 2755]|uniref:hypothetical protein n=1 Tax=Flavobacterium sp. 2755 TaxID=2817765 RepID=UPI002854255F|nr:hypothetical protein [Flavobacterium sp. 2755]MDR6761038.1 opacity protein-like surface antigen [Flavobacterium sp. 2755]
MENKTEIGKAIKSKLDALDKNPSDFVWSKIEKDLDDRRHKRVLFWSVAGIFVAAFFSTIFYLTFDFQEKLPKQENLSNKEISTVKSGPKQIAEPKLQKKGTDEITTISKSKSVKLIKQSTKLVSSTTEYEEYEVVKKYKVVLKREKITSSPIKTKATKSIRPAVKKQPIAAIKKDKTVKGHLKKAAKPHVLHDNKKSHKKSNPGKTSKNTVTVKDTLNSNDIEKTPERVIEIKTETKIDTVIKKDSISLKKKTTPKREYKEREHQTQTNETEPDITISAFYGPAIFGSLNSNSMISPAMNDLSLNHPITSHYGIYVKTMYNKVGFRAGFSKINLKTSTRLDENLIPDYKNIELKSSINIKETFANSNEVDLIQKLSYYELPIEFVYAVKKDDTKIGADIFTGFSFLVLDKNQLYLKSENVSQQDIGKAKNISGINISYNLGIGISYKLTEKWGLDLNPLFKYYLSTFNENKESKPYSLSLQTGLSYKF